MKKIISLFLIFIAALCAAPVFAADDKAPAVKDVNLILDGENFPGVSLYVMSGKTVFFSLRELSEVYNATLEWKPVSSTVMMRMNNKKVELKANSDLVIFGKEEKKMSLPTRLIKGELYISPEILTSPEFSDIAEMDTSWNPKTSVLTVTHRSNIAAIRYFTAPDNTQVIIETEEPLPYEVFKSSGAIVLHVHKGKVQRDFAYPNNGAVRDITYETEGKYATVKINLEQKPKLVKVMALKNPYRIAVDIEHSKEVDIATLSEVTIPEMETSTAPAVAEVSGTYRTVAAVPLGVSQITEMIAPMESDQDNKDLEKVPVAKFDEKNIIDDSYAIIDDTSTIPEMIPRKVAKSKTFVRKKIIVIDAGHGGEDPGAVGPNGTKEKDVNIAIAYALKKILDDDDNYEVVMTRKDDTFIPLVERTNIANEYNADLFVSIHCNANFDRAATGFEIYFLSEKATDSEAAATARLENSVLELEGKPSKKRALLQDMLWSMMLNEYINDSSELCSFIAAETPGRLKIPNKGVKQASLYVLRGAKMPAVLAESAYLSNYAEEAKLNTKKFQTAVADSIYEGINKYYARKEKLEKNSSKK